MSNRFDWENSSKESCAIELKQRDVLRRGYTDSHPACLFCNHRLRKGEFAYHPSVGTSRANKIIAHKDCVDDLVTQIEIQKTGAKLAEAVNSRATVSSAPPAPPAQTKAASRKIDHKPVAAGRSAAADARLPWLAGWHDGVLFGFDKLKAPTASNEPEYLEGWREGVMYAMERQQHQ